MTPPTDNTNPIWLSPEVLQWFNYSGGGSEPNDDLRLRAHEIWNHAQKALEHASTELQLVDVITTLKRAIDQRLRALNGIYVFDSIPIRDKPSDTLGVLEFFEVVRPSMFRNLLEIRNAVEHQDAVPPDYASCEIFLDFAWYFLRSTDRMLQIVSNELHFCPTRDRVDDQWLELKYGPGHDWNPIIRGWVKPELVSSELKHDWIVVLAERSETYAELSERKKAEKTAWNPHDERDAEDIYLYCKVRGPQTIVASITKLYFSAV